MKKSILDEINSLFETGEIQTIKFSKTGKTTVKYVKEPKLIQYSKCDNILQVIKEHAELSKSLEKVETKPKSFVFEGTFTCENVSDQIKELGELAKTSTVSMRVFTKPYESIDNRSRFERFYDAVGNWLGGGKSFAPDECKSFA